MDQPEAFRPLHMPVTRLDLPGKRELHLWYLHLGALGGPLHNALAGDTAPGGRVLPGVRQLRFTRRFYLRLLLGAYLGVPGKGVEINRSNRGKPVLDLSVHDSDLQFSMAKSEDRILIGISASHSLGVDLEPEGRKAHEALRLAERYFSLAEYEQLKLVAPERVDVAFLHAWAGKEAVVKASGLGIANQLCRFTLQMDPDLPPAVLAMEDGNAAEWTLKMVRPSDGFVGAVATRQPVKRTVPPTPPRDRMKSTGNPAVPGYGVVVGEKR
jgi:4'-phosphopantetheinyl transferase